MKKGCGKNIDGWNRCGVKEMGSMIIYCDECNKPKSKLIKMSDVFELPVTARHSELTDKSGCAYADFDCSFVNGSEMSIAAEVAINNHDRLVEFVVSVSKGDVFASDGLAAAAFILLEELEK